MAGYKMCCRCDGTSIANLDGDDLCKFHADLWARAQAPDPFQEPELITPEDTEGAFKEKFASSLESQADAMDSAIEAFVDYKDVQGNMMACRSWLRRTAKSIREM